MVNHVYINVNHNIISWLTIWKPCHHHDITTEYHSIARLNEAPCRLWYHLITWYHGPTWDHLYMYKHDQPCYHDIPCQPCLTMKILCSENIGTFTMVDKETMILISYIPWNTMVISWSSLNLRPWSTKVIKPYYNPVITWYVKSNNSPDKVKTWLHLLPWHHCTSQKHHFIETTIFNQKKVIVLPWTEYGIR